MQCHDIMMSFTLAARGDQGSLFFLCVVLNRASRSGAARAVEDLTVDEWRILIAVCFSFDIKPQLMRTSYTSCIFQFKICNMFILICNFNLCSFLLRNKDILLYYYYYRWKISYKNE